MDFEGIYASAESACSNLKDRDYTKIFVASLIGDTNARGVLEKFQAETEKKGLKAMVIRTGSLGYYDLEPLVMIEKPGLPPRTYYNMTPDGASGLVEDYLRKDNPGTDLALTGGPAGPLFEAETRIALRNCGHIDPENIHHYVYLRKGYSGLSKALTMSKEEVIAEVEKSGLRGRGGGGFHTADKWRACREAEGKEKIMVCDAMDADPRSKTARLLLESDPHGVLEGMLIAAYAVGASRCMICLNREYHNAIQGLAKAIDQLKEYGLIGDHILESTFHCEIEIREAEAFLVMGEETALISVLEEKQAMPYVRPPFPAVKGFKNRPTLINNLETLANVSAVFQQGPGCLSGSGKDRDNGTKVITLSGDVVHPYTVEVTFGTTVRHIIEKISGAALRESILPQSFWTFPLPTRLWKKRVSLSVLGRSRSCQRIRAPWRPAGTFSRIFTPNPAANACSAGKEPIKCPIF